MTKNKMKEKKQLYLAPPLSLNINDENSKKENTIIKNEKEM